MMRKIGVFPLTLSIALPITLIAMGAGFAVPVPGQGRDSSLGVDCALMAQALQSAPSSYRVIASDRPCKWRELGIINAVAYDDLAEGLGMPNRSVMSPKYSLLGFKAQVDVGVTLALLAGSGRNCTYYRFWGAWHAGGCKDSWIA
jgi:hypothetical protein